MKAGSLVLSFDGRILNRGFWLYTIDIVAPDRRVLYVGRTGDSSSPHASSPFSRVTQHLDHRTNAKGNALLRNLRAEGIDPSCCTFRLIAHGPLHPEVESFDDHKPVRDRMAALEKGLAAALRESGFVVLGKHSARLEPDRETLNDVVRSVLEQLVRTA